MTRNNKRLLFAFKFLGLFLLYFVTAKAGLKLNAVNGFATLVWPPSGIALAALLIFGYRFWPAIALGAFLVNFTSGASFLVAIGITIGNTLESLIGVYLLRQIGFHYSLEHLKDVLGLVGFGALLSTLISATVGVSSLFLSHTIPYESFFSTWSAWWIGDMLGILLVASFLLAWSGNFLPKLSLKKVAELLVIISLLLITSAIVFSDFFKAGPEYHPFTYIIFPPLIWIALRFDQRTSTTSVLLVAAIAVWGTVHSAGPFVTSDLSQSLLLLQLFIAVLAITVLIISAIVAERKDADQRKDDFIALTSHELKTPVTSLKMFTQVLAHKLQKLGEADISSSLSRMDVQLNKLTRVIQDLLDASRLNLGKLEYNIEAFSVNNLVSEVVEDMQRVSEKHPLSLKFQPIPEIMGDKDRIRQVLINLINNAIKYSADGEKIVIIVTQDEGSARVSIQDFGIGISKAHQNKIFERFYQASKNRSSGLGVGLYICKEIIERHKGKIWVESEENKGSTFYFTLPFKTLSLEAVK